MCDDYDLDVPTLTREAWRRARKPRKCCVCAEMIAAGDRYHYLTGRWDGEWSEFHHCARCWLLFEAADKHAGGGAMLTLDCDEPWDDAPDDVAALAFLSREDAQSRVPAAPRGE